MKIGNWFRALERVRIQLGAGYLDRFVVFELKWLGGLYINFWEVEKQDRFHQHAFAAISFILKGSYTEVQFPKLEMQTFTAPAIRFIPRTNNHLLLNSKGVMTVLITGPWDRCWTETKLDSCGCCWERRVLGWGKENVTGWHPYSAGACNGKT